MRASYQETNAGKFPKWRIDIQFLLQDYEADFFGLKLRDGLFTVDEEK